MPPILAFIIMLLQSLEENFTLAVSVFIIGFIATITIVIFVIVMHRSVHRSRRRREQDTEGVSNE